MQLKKINPKALLYHYFERTVTEFALFDDDLDMPVAWGSRNLVDALVRKLSRSVSVVYYKRDTTDKISFKRKVVFEGKKEEDETKKG
jgi:hypothetical protein